MKRIALAIMLLLGVSGVLVTPGARADETWCNDGHVFPGGMATPIIGYPGAPLGSGPVTLGLQTTVTGSQVYIEACYGTGPAGSSGQLAAGNFYLNAAPGSSDTYGGTAETGCDGDGSRALVAPDCTPLNAGAVTTPTITPTYGTGGLYLTAVIPFTLCAGICVNNSSPLNTTGVIVGTLSPTPAGPGGTSAAYGLNGLCVKVHGATVFGSCTTGLGDAGVTTTGTNPINERPATPGPCVFGVCLPNYDYLGTTGNQIATLWLPGAGAFPVYGVHTCIYQKDASTPCPY